MTQDKRTNFNTQISEEASEWFVEFRLGDIDATGRRKFDTWIRSSPEHLRAYLEIAALWNEGGSLGAHPDLNSDALIALARAEGNVVPLDPAAGAERSASVSNAPPQATGELHRRSPPALAGESSVSAAEVPPARRLSRRRFWSLAAALTAIIVGTVLTVSWQLGRGTVYATTVVERRTIKLEDGSSVELNSRSRIRVRFSKAQRDVELLEGQVLFQVAKNPTRPFVVHSDAVRVRAVGTQFDVNRKAVGTTVTVVEGRVAVYQELPFSSARPPEAINTKAPPSMHGVPTAEGLTALERSGPAWQAGSPAIYLTAGEQLTLTGRTASVPHRASTSAATAWTQGELVFESALLTDVAEEFNRYSERRLTVEDHGTHPLQLSGVFTTDSGFLIRYLRQRPDITVEESATEIRIVRHD